MMLALVAVGEGEWCGKRPCCFAWPMNDEPQSRVQRNEERRIL